jgi:phosphoenolpyruvate-protein phosphotransferase
VIALAGIALVAGSATGAAVTVQRLRTSAAAPERRFGRQELVDARRAAAEELRHLRETLPDGPAREILSAHVVLIDDPVLSRELERHFDAGRSAEEALAEAASALATRFESLSDPTLRSRAGDLRDVCNYIARHLTGGSSPTRYPEACVVCAVDLSPADVLELADSRPRGFVLEQGAESSHAAILLRALGIPTVIRVPDATALVHDGDHVLVDGNHGRVVVHPDHTNASISAAVVSVTTESDPQSAATFDGLAVSVNATIAGIPDLHRAIAAGADGVGLFRTEWLFLKGDRLPSEAEQVRAYAEIAALAGERPIVVRAIDLGSDKQPRGLRLPAEPNPALGLRGVRLGLTHPELLQTQMRALLRAFAGRRFRLLLPMVNDPGEVTRVREILHDTAGAEACSRVDVGAMIETPAAALMATELASVVDFLSIGTNDLTQYVLAADRETRAPVYQPFHPAVLRLVRHVASAAAGRTPLSACGEAAADPLFIPLLIGFGITTLSVPPEAIIRTKRFVRGLSAESARAVADELIELPTAAAVLARLRELEGCASSGDVRAAGDAR